MIVGDGERNPAWRDALARFDRQLAARGMAEKTRRAYGRRRRGARRLGRRTRASRRSRSTTESCAATPHASAAERATARGVRCLPARLRASSPRSVRSSVRWSNGGSLTRTPPTWSATPRRRAASEGAAHRRGRAAARPHPGAHAARSCATARCSSCLFLRAALRGGREPGRRRRGLRRRGAEGARQGLQDPHRPGRRAGPAGARALPGTAAVLPLLRARDEPALFLSKRGRRLSPSDVRRRLADVAAPRGPVRATPPRMPCATPLPPICWKAGRTCARSRSCWATPASRRPRSTLG